MMEYLRRIAHFILLALLRICVTIVNGRCNKQEGVYN